MVALVITLLFVMVITAGAIGYVIVQKEVMKQRQMANAKRMEAEQAAAKRQRRWAEEQRVIAEEQKRNAEENAARMEMARADAIRTQQARQEEQRIAQEKINQRMREQMRFDEMVRAEELQGKNFAEIVNVCQRFYETSRGQFVLPNGGEQGSGLSWRVHLLPFMNQQRLYTQFKLNEPWDSEHNKQLLLQMPSVFGANQEGKTRIRSFQNVDGKAGPT